MNNDELGCQFGVTTRCHLLVDESGYCPRHGAMVALHGEERALQLEFGIECYICCKLRPEDTIDTCKICLTENVCAGCRGSKRCCRDAMDALEDEAEEHDDQAESSRREAELLRERADIEA